MAVRGPVYISWPQYEGLYGLPYSLSADAQCAVRTVFGCWPLYCFLRDDDGAVRFPGVSPSRR